ncbi:MAG TPA: hypothetical protein PKG50_05025 [Candidatus Bipolaricaulis anaerobius]|nr:hypothetical protein [Candidatus Bipolaricaulis anaerobius]MDD3747861.1 hypothetical protein [Candidatus Bipolaricaulis anaerobius]HNR24768.1 hypothetical protein [Candidatus Bipolaricaulis anaerobius]HNS24121.1 hypothetical protein [Candidatus Bipolaricaulis anaerobius]HOD73301.1 hypothetical protein [Candidatus Bipolaricaulis anaerobius]
MTEEIGTRVRDLLRTDPQLAIVLGEILGPPVGSPEAPPRPW